MGGFVIFLSFIVFAWAVVGFFKPTAVKLPNRAASVGVWILSVALFAAGGALLPETEEDAAEVTAALAAVAAAVAEEEPAAPPPTPAPPPRPTPRWSNLNFVDEFGEPTGRGAVSETVRSIRPMSFPYTGTDARIFVDCDRTWIRFSEAPNLIGGNIADGYTQYSVSVRVDGEDVGRWRVSQSWGDKDLRFTNGSEASTAISSGSTFAVALPWHGEGSVAFSWPLTGSSEAIAASCD